MSDSAIVTSNPLHLRGMGKLVCATVVGNTIEYFDFNVYGTLTALVFGQLFFPSDNAFVSTLLAFGTFAVGFISRPLGGIIFGTLGDRLGRKPMLMWSLGVMGTATVLIGCLPTYQSVGIAAPLLLILLRLIQGFGIGGEWGGAVTLMIEHSPESRRGFFGSLVQTGSGIGNLLASGTIMLLLGVWGQDVLAAWAWRVPFLLSAVLVIIGAYVRLHIEESPEFEEVRKLNGPERQKSPLWETIRRFPRTILLGVGMSASVAAVGFLCGVFITNYATQTLHFAETTAVTANIVGLVAYLIMTVVGGWCSDRYGRVRCYLIGAVAMIVGVAILFWLLPMQSIPLYMIGMIAAESANGFIFGIQAAMFAALFPPEVRYTGISLGGQIATVLGGGLMPTFATMLTNAAGGGTQYLLAYVTALCLLTVVCTWAVTRVHETHAFVQLQHAEGSFIAHD